MGTATTTYSGHVARAIRFFNEPEVFVGIAVTDPWTDLVGEPDETSPPNPEISSVNLGRIHKKTYSEGGNLSPSNCDVSFNFTPFRSGLEENKAEYVLTANVGGTTFKLERKVSETERLLISNSVSGSPNGNSSLIPGLTIKTPTSFTPGDTFSFKVDGPIGFKKASEVRLVYPHPNGEIDYRGSSWKIATSDQDAYDNGARYVFVKVSLNYNELPVTDFRQIGVFSGLVRESSVSDPEKQNLLPEEVLKTGALELIDNRTVITRNEYQKETFSFIIEH